MDFFVFQGLLPQSVPKTLHASVHGHVIQWLTTNTAVPGISAQICVTARRITRVLLMVSVTMLRIVRVSLTIQFIRYSLL